MDLLSMITARYLKLILEGMDICLLYVPSVFHVCPQSFEKKVSTGGVEALGWESVVVFLRALGFSIFFLKSFVLTVFMTVVSVSTISAPDIVVPSEMKNVVPSDCGRISSGLPTYSSSGLYAIYDIGDASRKMIKK